MTIHLLNQRFLKACEEGETSEVERLLDLGVDVELKSFSGITPLGLAAFNGRTATCLALLARNAKIEAKDNDGDSPLSFAVLSGEITAVVALLACGANIESKCNVGRSPLNLAATGGKIEVVRLLLARCANMECKDDDGDSPLKLAITGGEVEITLMLIAAGANIASALALMQGSKIPNSIASCIDFPLHKAAKLGMGRECIQMLDIGYDIDQKDDNGMTPTQHAEASNEEEALTALRSWAARQAASRIMLELSGAKP